MNNLSSLTDARDELRAIQEIRRLAEEAWTA
jgi:hypothetical protein